MKLILLALALLTPSAAVAQLFPPKHITVERNQTIRVNTWIDSNLIKQDFNCKITELYGDVWVDCHQRPR